MLDSGRGNVLVGCDASGLELRMLAHYMKDLEYVETVVNGSSKLGTDVHTKTRKRQDFRPVTKRKLSSMAFYTERGQRRLGRSLAVVLRLGKSLSILSSLPHRRLLHLGRTFPRLQVRALYRGLMVERYGYAPNTQRSIRSYKALARSL